MNVLDYELKEGRLLGISTGEYSDHMTEGPFRMLRTITKRELVEAFKKYWAKKCHELKGYVSEHTNPDKPDGSYFSSFLVVAGYVEAVDEYDEWHVGSYGRFET